MKKSVECVRGWFLDITHEASGLWWRGELWHNPYDGTRFASTRWVRSRQQAQADAKRFLKVPRRKGRTG